MNKKRICILFGGVSSEYEVSCNSAASIVENISRDAFDICLVGITKEGKWFLYSGGTASMRDYTWVDDPGNIPAVISPDRSVHGLMVMGDEPKTIYIDCVFPVLHGKNGEDGTMQGLLEISGIPYVGCGVLASSVCMDKVFTTMILDRAGIAHVRWRSFLASDELDYEKLSGELEEYLGYPMFVKPANAGSSVGITKVHNASELRPAFELAFSNDSKIIVEQAAVGKELECAGFGNGIPFISRVAEIIPKHEFYDYDAKYIDASVTVLPADIPESLSEKMRETAAKAYVALNCRGFSRIDFLWDEKSDTLYLNEVNTIPGFTAISMYPQCMQDSGMSYSDLITNLINLAMEE
ncbi:MAG: D-alanine--D-alanine ligase [Oscillospiraceae bacterium]|nr:D-alanine--D-alanine ligase [Oscillospiraceae bacterium]